MISQALFEEGDSRPSNDFFLRFADPLLRAAFGLRRLAGAFGRQNKHILSNNRPYFPATLSRD
jgi:hypothetical protein